MLNLHIDLSLRELPSAEGVAGRRILGLFRFLNDHGLPWGPRMMTEPYDWERWFQWLSDDLDKDDLERTGGLLLHPSATVELGSVVLRAPNLTPFYLAQDVDADRRTI